MISVDGEEIGLLSIQVEVLVLISREGRIKIRTSLFLLPFDGLSLIMMTWFLFSKITFLL